MLCTLVNNPPISHGHWTAGVLVQSHHERPDSAHSVYKIRPVSRLYPFLHLCGPDSSQIEGQSKLPDFARREVNQNLEIASHSYLISYTRIQLLVFLYIIIFRRVRRSWVINAPCCCNGFESWSNTL
jgi:hypothetical protein